MGWYLNRPDVLSSICTQNVPIVSIVGLRTTDVDIFEYSREEFKVGELYSV